MIRLKFLKRYFVLNITKVIVAIQNHIIISVAGLPGFASKMAYVLITELG